MKKLVQILITFSILFFGINEVKAEEYEGTCELQKESTGECTYSCKFEKDSDSLTFDYRAFFKGSELSGEITNSSSTSKDGTYYFGRDHSGLTNSMVSVNIAQNPSLTTFYDVNDDFVCPVITPKNNVTKESTTTVIPGIGGASTPILVTNNNITFTAQKKDTPDVTPDYDAACGLLGEETSETVIFLKKAYQYLKVLLPILIIALGIVDFVKVVVTGKDDDMKKAVKRLTTRIVVAVVFVLVPVIIQILINISGLTGEYSGINDGIKAMLCILG